MPKAKARPRMPGEGVIVEIREGLQPATYTLPADQLAKLYEVLAELGALRTPR